jgi:hypothetical protein
MMQVATTQAARALAALRSSRRRDASRRRRAQGRVRRPVRAADPTTLDRAVRQIDSLPRVRRERVVAARTRLAAGEHPSADDVAAMIVRRSLCDRLR